MPIDLGGYQLDNAYTAVREEYEVVGGRQTRAIQITGLLRGTGNLAALVEALDNIAQAVSETVPTELVLRAGRRLFARRERFIREVSARALVGQFVLALRADDAWEESAAANESSWNIGLSGATHEVSNGGNASAPLRISLGAESALVRPAVGDGERTLRYEGTVPNGAMLVFDAALREVTLDGVDVTPYTSGEFPMVEPGEQVLIYSDDPASGHMAVATVTFRDRWW